jgi:hypothetical protein
MDKKNQLQAVESGLTEDQPYPEHAKSVWPDVRTAVSPPLLSRVRPSLMDRTVCSGDPVPLSPLRAGCGRRTIVFPPEDQC